MLSRAFGLSLDFETPPPGAWETDPAGGPSLRLRTATTEEIVADWSGREAVGWKATIDGAPFLVERGRAGDHRFSHGERSVQLLSSDGELLRCVSTGDEPLQWRVVLDSVLFSIALIAGFEALHAGAVATERGVIAVTAGAGGGKSTLLAELLSEGHTLLSDDVVVLEARGEAPPLAHPGAPLMTVPKSIRSAPGAAIGSVGDENWVAVPTCREPLPLMGLVVLNRSPGMATGLHGVQNPLAVLMESLLRFPRSTERELARFEIAGAIASHVPIWELTADPQVDPGSLATLLRTMLIP